MASKLTSFPAAALRLYFGGKGGVFYFPLKLLNKCWPSKIVYINHNDSPPPPPPNLVDKILLRQEKIKHSLVSTINSR